MPVTYVIEPSASIVRTRCVGRVRFDEVMRHFADLAADPDCPDTLDVLLDLSELTSLPETWQLRSVSSEMGLVSHRVRFGACAIVATSDAVFGIARMYEVLAEDHFRATRVFREMRPAEEWLASHRQVAGGRPGLQSPEPPGRRCP